MATKKLAVKHEEILAIAGSRKWMRLDRRALVASAIRMSTCNLQQFLKIKPGMTNQEKNDALDAAVEKWVNCLQKH